MSTTAEIETQILNPLFDNEFNKNYFFNFLREIFPDLRIKDILDSNSIPLRKEYREFVSSAHFLGSYRDENSINKDSLGIYVVELKKSDSLLRARTMQRNLIGNFIEDRFDAALVVFYDDSSDWRLSFVKLEYKLVRDKKGNIGSEKVLTSPKRHSFLVGAEKNHTCKSRFLELITQHINPSLNEIEEVFNVETVTNEFFNEYKRLFDKLKKDLDNIIKKDKKTKDKKIFNDFTNNNISTSDFVKKLMGQIVFIYFLQKKGWLGVQEEEWGDADKDFFKKLYNKEYKDWSEDDEGQSFFNNCLEPLFYKGFSYPADDDHCGRFGFRVPFLNGGLFSPIINYDWKNTVIDLDDKIFEEIIETFDRFNFTVREDDPLEKEVAVDPEMLGKVFEKLLDSLERGSKGSFYTPRDIVHYMCKKSIISYLNAKTDIPLEDIEDFIENSNKYVEKAIRYPEDIKNNSNLRLKLPDSIFNSDLNELDVLLAEVKVADPAVGSGAFPVGMMNEIVNARHIIKLLKGEYVDIYSLKKETIKNSLYCVDIDYSATDITKLRFWLSLIVDEEEIEPLPNLSNNVMCGNSLIDTVADIKLYNYSSRVFLKDSTQSTFDTNNAFYKFKRINELKNKYFDENITSLKNKEKEEIDKLKWEFVLESYKFNGGDINKILDYETQENRPFFLWELEFSEVFSSENPGFDIIIGNPPYVPPKKIDTEVKKAYETIYGLKDDLYNYFFVKSFDILRDEGVLSFITSNTYLTINSKINLRHLFEKNRIIELNKVNNVFEDPMVSPAIILLKKEDMSGINYSFTFKDSNYSFTNPEIFIIDIEKYRNAPFNVIFKPTELNLQSYDKYNDKVNELVDNWFVKIRTSAKIKKYSKELDEYRNSLTSGDLTLLGLITEGGVGLQTANNGKFVGVLEGSKNAEKILESRPKKLFEAISENDIVEYDFINSNNDAKDFLNTKSETEIREIFDNLKEKYGRDIFGQGYIFKIINKNEIVDLNTLSDDEKENGLSPSKPSWILYDKGDKDGNRWYLKTPFYINWSIDNVNFLKENSGKKGKGMPVVRNPQFYFREGFCWSDIHTTYIKSRLKEKGIYDVKSMSLFSLTEKTPDWYIVCLLNSKYISEYVDDFINNTQTFQINDARVLPIIVPSNDQLVIFESIFNESFDIKNQFFDGLISKEVHDEELDKIQIKLDKEVEKLYGLST